MSSHRRRGESGQSLVELALFAPIMVLVLVLAVDLGRAFMVWVNVNNMARIGANYAAINPDGWQGAGSATKQARYAELMNADYEQTGCMAPANLPAPVFSGYDFGDTATVSVDCDFTLITPLLSSLFGGEIPVRASAVFTIRVGSPGGSPIGGILPTPIPTISPPPTPTPTPAGTAEPTATPDPSGSPDPTPSPTPTLPLVQIDFYGTPTSIDSQGGGPAPSPGFETIVGIPPLSVTFTNTTVGDQWVCLWDFGDGETSSSCASNVQKTYTLRGLYHVTLHVNGQLLTRPGYVLVGCKVPSFAGVRKNSAASVWVDHGFTADNLTALSGNGNYTINFQSLAGGLLNPPGGCAGAEISVGP